MKTLGSLFLLLIVLAVSGCATSGSALDQSKVATLTHIHIVTIEGPPLHGEDLKTRDITTSLISSSIIYGPIGLAWTLGYLMTDLPEKEKQRMATIQDSVTFLNENEIWEPTVEIAGETKRHLEVVSNFSVGVDPEIKPLPGIEQREITYLMENWKPTLRNWYNMETSSFDYSEQPSSGAVLEIGLLDYSLSRERLWITVMMKLVNPTSRLVIANAQCRFGTNYDDLEKLFENDASGFKKLFRETTAKHVPECIEELGLHKK